MKLLLWANRSGFLHISVIRESGRETALSESDRIEPITLRIQVACGICQGQLVALDSDFVKSGCSLIACVTAPEATRAKRHGLES